jgi:hypothetical protein
LVARHGLAGYLTKNDGLYYAREVLRAAHFPEFIWKKCCFMAHCKLQVCHEAARFAEELIVIVVNDLLELIAFSI